VAGIETVWSGQVAPPTRDPKTIDFSRAPAGVQLSRGDEMGRFMLGSTVILLFPENSVEWLSDYSAGSPTRMGEAMAARVNPGN
jgi:phosphatidylserine decarboxylase